MRPFTVLVGNSGVGSVTLDVPAIPYASPATRFVHRSLNVVDPDCLPLQGWEFDHVIWVRQPTGGGCPYEAASVIQFVGVRIRPVHLK